MNTTTAEATDTARATTKGSTPAVPALKDMTIMQLLELIFGDQTLPAFDHLVEEIKSDETERGSINSPRTHRIYAVRILLAEQARKLAIDRITALHSASSLTTQDFLADHSSIVSLMDRLEILGQLQRQSIGEEHPLI